MTQKWLKVNNILEMSYIEEEARTCKYCGHYPLFWKEYPKKNGTKVWWLHTIGGKPHTCKKFKAQKKGGRSPPTQ